MTTMIQRTYRADLDVRTGDQRVIVGRAVPYGVAEYVSDDGVSAYREEWQRGVFAAIAKPANLGRMRKFMNDAQRAAWESEVERRARELPPTLNYTHDESDPLNWIGETLGLEERADGLYGEWRVDEGERGDWALQKVRTGQLVGLSIGAVVLDTQHRGEVRVRTKARLLHVALVREAAFNQAMVLSTRAAEMGGRDRASVWAERADRLRRHAS